MTWTDPIDATANVTAVTAAREKTYILDNLRAIAEWTSYTPTLTQSSAVTKTVNYAKYRSFGGTVEVQVYLTATGAGTANNVITVSLPVSSIAGAILIIGNGEYSDQGTAVYGLNVILNTATTVKFRRLDTNPGDYFGKDPNMAIASTDNLAFTCVYEAV